MARQKGHVYTGSLQTTPSVRHRVAPVRKPLSPPRPDPTSVRRRPWRLSLSSSAVPPPLTASGFLPLLLSPIARRRGRRSRPSGSPRSPSTRCAEQGPGQPLRRARPSAAAGEAYHRVTGRARACCFRRRSGAPRPPTLSGSSSCRTLRSVPNTNLFSSLHAASSMQGDFATLCSMQD
jgi:hypothetical protein